MGTGADGQPLLAAEHVHKIYRTGEIQVQALVDLDLTVRRGEMVAVMGPSGSGKTTLLNCLSGLDDIDGGRVLLDGQDLFKMSDAARTTHRAKAMGFIFQSFNLIPVFTAAENVELPLLLAGTPSSQAQKRATEMLERVGLGGRTGHRPNELSGGEQQRVTIARALASRPMIVWADEPTGNLDSRMADQVVELLHELNHVEGQTIVLVTHDASIGASVPRLIHMRDGRLVKDERRIGNGQFEPGAQRGVPQVDGLLTVRGDQAAATTGSGGTRKADPRVSVWEVDFGKAAAFGGTTDGGSGLSGPAPGVGETVVNADLASALGIRAGDVLTVYLYGRPTQFRVARVVPTKGVAGAGTGAVTRNAFFAPGTLIQAAKATRSKVQPQTFTFVSNTGGVEGGNALSNAVDSKIKAALGPLAAQGTSVEKAKQRLLDAAKASGDSLGSFFLFIGSFSIIAGVLLLVNIFVMLAEERKSELGMLRAIGMKRSRLVRSFVIEGTVYALVASLVGIVVGSGVGRAVAIVAARIFPRVWAEEGGPALALHVSHMCLFNAFAVGLLVAFGTGPLTIRRVSRINVIAAIRD